MFHRVHFLPQQRAEVAPPAEIASPALVGFNMEPASTEGWLTQEPFVTVEELMELNDPLALMFDPIQQNLGFPKDDQMTVDFDDVRVSEFTPGLDTSLCNYLAPTCRPITDFWGLTLVHQQQTELDALIADCIDTPEDALMQQVANPMLAAYNPATNPLQQEIASLEKVRKPRNRLKADQMDETTLAKSREMNRIAAQRQRDRAKVTKKKSEKIAADLDKKNSALRKELEELQLEAKVLKKVILSNPDYYLQSLQMGNHSQATSTETQQTICRPTVW